MISKRGAEGGYLLARPSDSVTIGEVLRYIEGAKAVKTQRLATERETSFVLVFDKGDDPVVGIAAFAREQQLGAAHFTGIGAFSDLVVGYFDRARKDYEPIPIPEQVEVLSLVGVMEELAHEGMTMIVVTHEMGFAKVAADRVAMMDEGRIIEEGPPEHFFLEPREERTKQFLSKIL